MQAKVARVENPLSFGLDQEGHAVKGGMVHRVSRDGEVANLEGFAGSELLLTLLANPRLLGELQPHVHHVAGAWTEPHRDFFPGVLQQARMIAMGMGQENRIGRRACVLAIAEQARNPGNGFLFNQFRNGLAIDRLGVEGFPVFIHQRHPAIQDDPGGLGSEFDTVSTDLMGSPVNHKFHAHSLSPVWLS